MSWQGYIDTSLLGSGKVDKAAIFSAAGDSVWATSKGFTVQPSEMKHLLNGYAKSAEPNANPLFAEGFHIGGTKYFTIKADDRSIYGKQGKEGTVIVKTKQAIIVAHYPETVQPGEAAKVVEQLADYLIGVGY